MTASGPVATAVPKRRRRRWSFVITALLLGSVAALVLVEIGFRWFWTLPPQFAEFQQQGLYAQVPGGGVGLQPGYRGTLQMGPGAPVTRVEVNALGMRGPEIGGKQAAERRVLVLGDSLVFGYGVEAEQALPARLEAELGSRGAQAKVGNGGVVGFGPSHSVAHMARLDAPFGADAFVICTYLGNDVMDDVKSLRRVYAGQLLQGDVARLAPVSWRTRLAIRSRAWLWVETWIANNHPQSSPLAHVPPDPEEAARMAGMPMFEKADAGLFLDAEDEKTAWADGAPPVIPRVVAALRTSLERAKKIAGERPLWFVVLPTVWQVDEGRRLEKLQAIGFDPLQYPRGGGQRRLLQSARDLGITALDATPILAAEKDHAALFLADGGHLSVRGNEVVARWLAAELATALPR